jgi:hypothetical protein
MALVTDDPGNFALLATILALHPRDKTLLDGLPRRLLETGVSIGTVAVLCRRIGVPCELEVPNMLTSLARASATILKLIW